MGISHSVSSVSSVLPALSFFKPAPATPTVSSFDILARAPFHASAVLHRDVGGMNSRGRATPKAATEKVKKASAEKSSDEKDQRAQERAERDKRKAEVRAAQLAKSKDQKEKHAAATAKKVQRVQQQIDSVRFSERVWTAEEEAEFANREAEEQRAAAAAARKRDEARAASEAKAAGPAADPYAPKAE